MKWRRASVHGVVHALDRQVPMYVLHGLAGVAHGIKGLLVDVGGLDGLDFALDGHDLRGRLLEGVFVGFFATEGGFRFCKVTLSAIVHIVRFAFVSHSTAASPRLALGTVRLHSSSPALRGMGSSHVRFLFVLMYLRANASWSSIWFCRCFSRLFNMSIVDRSCRMAFLGASFRFCAPPPNQPRPQPDIM